MTRVLYLDCIGGIAGDMFLAALLHAGADRAALERIPEQLGIGAVEIRVTQTERHGVGALHVEVIEPAAPPPRTWRAMREIIESGELPPAARIRALDVFRRLAEAESEVHGSPVYDVHFHELGGIDTLVDVCGAAVLVDSLEIERVVCSPLPYPRGLTAAAHGILPVPAPATLLLLRGAPLVGVELSLELVTPTGAAIVASFASAYGPVPPLVLGSVGYGAGTADLPERPNLLRVLVGRAETGERGLVVLLETNLDDLSPELVPDAVERCVAAGALDVWTVPALMKKGRPGIVFSALARPSDERRVAAAILAETSALGVRVSRLARYELDRDVRTVAVVGGEVRVKLGILDGRVVNVAPEHDDCAAVAAATGRPVKEIWAEALTRAGTLESAS